MPSKVQKNLLPLQKNPLPLGFDSSGSSTLKNVEPVLDSRPPSKLNHSFTVPDRISSEEATKNDIYYGEDFVNSLRRNRHVRAREIEYVSSRGTKSEMGEMGPYRGPAAALHKQHMAQHAYGYNPSTGYLPYEGYPSGRQSLGPYLGRRTAHELAIYGAENTLPRRPQSSFDASAHSKYKHLSDVFTPNNRERDGPDQSSENEDESSGSDSEIARIHYEQEMTRRATAVHYNAVPGTGPNEYYYFGVIQLPQDRVQQIMSRMPPPLEYFGLPPIEKAAYLFYCILYQHHYPVDLFHKKFNREYFGYMCEGDSAEIALWKICKHTQDEFIAKRSASQLKAYEMSQKQLFSDDRETLDSRQSERGSRGDPEDESDRLSVDSALKEPMKFRVAHSFVRFGAGGKAVVLNVQNSENILEIRDLKSLIGEKKLLRLSNTLESFRGPLIAGTTPTHSVRLYVQRQIELILKSEAYRSNPSGGTASDCLLIWQLLEMLVQQQGRVTGPDLSRLLMTGCHVSEHRRHVKEKLNSLSPANLSERIMDPKAYDRFTQLLLGGHIKEAIESAVKDGLYTDAMILARRICSNDPQELERIETAFLSHRSDQNPVMTLLSVANGQPAPVLTSPPLDEASSWRSHAAIVLANLNTPVALGTVYQLGRVLARREQHAAADFCFLAVSLLAAGYNPFQPVLKSEGENPDLCQHITLIHATLGNDEEMDLECLKGFSVIDLHATEIFEYASRLANGGMPVNLSRSLAYQLCRLDYAEFIAEFGVSAIDAFRYSVEVARSVWDRCSEVNVEELERLHDLGERLKFVASADENDIAWLPALRAIIDERRKVIEEKPVPLKRDTSTPVTNHSDDDPGLTMMARTTAETQATQGLSESNDKRGQGVVADTTTLDSEAILWHAGHQEPINIASLPTKDPEAEIQKHEDNEYRMQPGQLQGRIRTYSSTGASAPTSQYSTIPPTPPISVKDSPTNSDSVTHTVVTSSTVPQASERTSRNAVRSYSNERKDLAKEVRRDLQGVGEGDSDALTEVTTDGNTTATSSHESTPRRNTRILDHPFEEGKMTGLTAPKSGVAVGDQSEEIFRATNMPSVSEHSDSSQQRNYGSDRSQQLPQEQQSDGARKDEKPHIKGKTISEHRQNSGLFSKLKATLAKAIPSTNEMILPDDKNPSIVWDPKLNRYVGEGIEEDTAVEPPPSIAPSSEKLNGSLHGSVGGLTAARLSGGSRYFNPLIETSPSKMAPQPVPLAPPVPVPASFGFIPSMPDTDDVPGESPFSIDTSPKLQEAEAAE